MNCLRRRASPPVSRGESDSRRGFQTSSRLIWKSNSRGPMSQAQETRENHGSLCLRLRCLGGWRRRWQRRSRIFSCRLWLRAFLLVRQPACLSPGHPGRDTFRVSFHDAFEQLLSFFNLTLCLGEPRLMEKRHRGLVGTAELDGDILVILQRFVGVLLQLRIGGQPHVAIDQ